MAETSPKTANVLAAEIERLRVEYNANVAGTGLPQMDAQEWEAAISLPLVDPMMNLVRWEDKQYPDRMCAWCFHPRSSEECNFAQGHIPYREVFA